MKNLKKVPSTAVNPSNTKNPRVRENPESIYSKKPIWKFTKFDKEGPKDVLPKTDKTGICEIFDKLKQFESMTWSQIKENNQSHYVQKDKLISDATKKLEQMKLDDIDELFSLRLTGKKRVWGILREEHFQIIWWDPEHKICPSPK